MPITREIFKLLIDSGCTNEELFPHVKRCLIDWGFIFTEDNQQWLFRFFDSNGNIIWDCNYVVDKKTYNVFYRHVIVENGPGHYEDERTFPLRMGHYWSVDPRIKPFNFK